jgi:CRP-like cAMP-binding protein
VHLLLPLANNLEVRRYRLGEYLLKEGQPPTGLFMVTRGQLRVGSEQLNLRSKDLFPEGRQKNRARQFRLKGCFHDMEGKIRIFDDDGKGGGRRAAEEEDRDSEVEGDGNPAIEVKRIF